MNQARLLYTLPAALVLATLSLGAHAGELRIYVTTPDGQPAPDVVVSLLPKTATATPVPLAEPAVVLQQEIRFVPYVTAVPQGSTVRFVNRDRFDHHVKSVPGGPLGSIAPAQTFDFRLAAARSGNAPSAEVKLDAPGATTVGCHLHGSMRAHLYASPTPWVAVTDAAGRALIADAPDGAAELRLWHPDQLVAQTQVPTQLASPSSTAEAKLNFSPRRRPPPRPPREYE